MSKKKRPQPTTCKTANCINPPAPGSKYCPMCHMTVGFQRQVDKAHRRGDTLGALVNTFLAFGSNAIREGRLAAPAPGNPLGPIVQPRQQRPQQRPPGHGQPDPFDVLGLDKTATEKDVRAIQRGAAEMWHADKGGGPQAQSRLAEINAAAEACIRRIKAQA